MHNKIIRLCLIVTLILCFALSGIGCTKGSAISQQAKFDQFAKNIFIREVQADTLSLNYSLAHPEKYGIPDAKATLGGYGINRMKEELMASENYLSRLKSYRYDRLTASQQLTYQILSEYLQENLQSGDYLYYNECLGPTTGIQAQLPILFAEYGFYNKKDIDEYIKLLCCVKDYFQDIISYEQEKSARGLFMNDSVASRIIDQCKTFIDDPENNFLITYFNQRISEYKGLTDREISGFEAANREAVLCYVIPAYRDLVEALTELKGTGTNSGGLYYYPKGREYYESLARYKTGSDKSMEAMIQMLNSAISGGVDYLSSLTDKNPSLIDQYLSFTSFPITDPKAILADLKADITKDFPAAVPVSCQIKYVPESLADYLSPAMYLVPPIDNYGNNNIYINKNSRQNLSMIYTTVAHEGYPGHLYQCVYFRNTNPAPIRNILNFTGYDEGWATYVEYYSYHLAGIDENLADFMETNNKVMLCMYARADIGIHYEGWTKMDTAAFIVPYVGDEKIANSIYDTLLEEPAIYLPYAIGYLEIEELRKEAEETLGNKFNAKEFHKFLLDIGPAQFDIIEEHLQDWMKSRMK